MLKIGPKYVKLKTDLQLACKRLKILQAKKIELSQRLQKEIANHLNKGKFMPAKIKVQTVIRYEAAQEAMEIIEMLCEQILDRYGLFEEMRELDQSLEQAVSSLIWVSPYMRSEIMELKGIVKQLSAKYGSDYSKSALKNKHLTVNPDLIERIKLNILSEDKIQQCLRNIAKRHSVPEDKKIELELYFSKADSSENKRIVPNINLAHTKTVRFSSAPNNSPMKEDTEDSETFEGYGSYAHDTSVSCKKTFRNLKFEKNIRPRVWRPQNFFHSTTLTDIPEENEDLETENPLHDQYHRITDHNNGRDSRGDNAACSVLGRHRTFNESSERSSDSKNKEVPTETEIRSNVLRSAFKKKGNLRKKIPTMHQNDFVLDSSENAKQNISKKIGYSDIILDDTANFKDNNPTCNDSDQPPSYEAVVYNTIEDVDVNHPYQFEVDIKLECFPQYPKLPTCPTLEDISEKPFENTESSHIGGNSEKDGKTYSNRKKPPT